MFLISAISSPRWIAYSLGLFRSFIVCERAGGPPNCGPGDKVLRVISAGKEIICRRSGRTETEEARYQSRKAATCA